MPAYVRLKDHHLLRAAIDRLSRIEGRPITQAEVASRAGLSTQRISQLATGVAPVIRAMLAAQLERALGLRRNLLFFADEPELIRDYLARDEHELLMAFLSGQIDDVDKAAELAQTYLDPSQSTVE